jgi:hypothetical protein
MDSSVKTGTKQGASIGSSGSQLFHSSEFMERDKEQSRRLHEPLSITSHTDPITGNDVMGAENHPYVIDGILTVYFESEKTRSDYLSTPFNHPVTKLSSKPSPEDDRGG